MQKSAATSPLEMLLIAISLCSAIAYAGINALCTLAWQANSATPTGQPRPLFCEWEPSERGSGWSEHGPYRDNTNSAMRVDRPLNFIAVIMPSAGHEPGTGEECCMPGRATVFSDWGPVTIVGEKNRLYVATGPNSTITLPVEPGAAAQADAWWRSGALDNCVRKLYPWLPHPQRDRLQVFLRLRPTASTQESRQQPSTNGLRGPSNLGRTDSEWDGTHAPRARVSPKKNNGDLT